MTSWKEQWVPKSLKRLTDGKGDNDDDANKSPDTRAHKKARRNALRGWYEDGPAPFCMGERDGIVVHIAAEEGQRAFRGEYIDPNPPKNAAFLRDIVAFPDGEVVTKERGPYGHDSLLGGGTHFVVKQKFFHGSALHAVVLYDLKRHTEILIDDRLFFPGWINERCTRDYYEYHYVDEGRPPYRTEDWSESSSSSSSSSDGDECARAPADDDRGVPRRIVDDAAADAGQ